MKLIYYLKSEQIYLGVKTAVGVIDIDGYRESQQEKIFGSQNITIDDVNEIAIIAEKVIHNSEFILEESKLKIASCVPHPQKIICIGLNYRRHAVESGMPVPTVPVVFNKFNNTLVNYGDDVSLGEVGEQFDYEVELGVVIGKRCKEVKESEALQYVLGYCVANDLSCRDLQFRSSQWLMGKSLDKFLPLGKFLVTADEIDNPQRLQLRCTLNGEIRQNSNTSDMIFPVACLIEDLSRHFTLEPGDLILTGTPEGVILGMPEKKWLRPGDIVKAEIEKLGFVENKMV
jgi:2-keto-4-pentenoate hydratase/2-oxohepta-3-ene-1,7-dioic acid hydratase in catechol pathway